MRRAYAGGFLATAFVSLALAGCSFGHGSSAADKAGGSTAPKTVRLAVADSSDQPDSATARYFAARVAKLSHGALRVDITFQAAGDGTAEVEQRTVHLVRAGRFDLGFVGARAWDTLGVTSFKALQAPFLITSYPILDRVVTSGIAPKMLDGLRSDDVIGLALWPDELRHPVGLEHPLVSLSDFSRARVRIQPSRVTSALMRALGAVPVEVSNSRIATAVSQHAIDGEELAFGNAPTESTVTANVTFFGKAVTLFAGRNAYRRLSGRERGELRQAARQTLEHAVATSPTESALAAHFCREGSGARVVQADKRQLAELVRAARPVYAELERNPQTRAFIARIRRLKSRTRAPAPPRVPASCSRAQRLTRPTGKRRSPSILNGTYHLSFTIRDERKAGVAANQRHAGEETRILWNGRFRWAVGQPSGLHGTYTIRGDEITFLDSGSRPPGETFVFSRDRDGTLHLKPVRPMDPGDQFVIAGEAWRRVGPPSPIP